MQLFTKEKLGMQIEHVLSTFASKHFGISFFSNDFNVYDFIHHQMIKNREQS